MGLRIILARDFITVGYTKEYCFSFNRININSEVVPLVKYMK